MEHHHLMLGLIATLMFTTLLFLGLFATSSPKAPPALQRQQLQFQLSEQLGDCSRIADLRGSRIHGRMTFCMIAYRPHYFLVVEEGTYRGDKFTRTGRKCAFSYVPESVVLGDRYRPDEKRFREGAIDTSISLKGYNPFTVSPSRILDSWKMTNDFVPLRRLRLTNWAFSDYRDKFNRYNMVTLVPVNGITDCIGYSCYHMYRAVAPLSAAAAGDAGFTAYLRSVMDAGLIQSYGP